MSRKPTMEDVKNLAGVSISTVSRVINGTRKVSADKTEAVNNAIKKLGYKPNELARSLVMRRSNTLGIILDDIGYSYMAQYMRGIDEIGKMYKYDILLYSTFGDFETQKKAVDFLSSKQVEGIIVISEKINPEVLYLIREHDIPYILLDNFYCSSEFKTVNVNFEDSMRSITNFVLENNHTKTGFIREKSTSSATELKESGYSSAVSSYGLSENIYTIKSDSKEAGYTFMSENYSKLKEKGITALLASSDDIALGVIHYCYDNNISIPEDLSITGFGNRSYSNLIRPSLTTVRLPFYDIGAISVRLLIKVVRKEAEFTESVNLEHEILVRDTVKKIK